ncbi:DUF3617 domain-containing protein [Sulfuricurvum sp.]|uniref:DUF3617 domain-containing protein n=1 Tax=Sulfuricurvum sp. TaxID=2025608 RepID=UPI0026244BB1|nr:DUF3617 domain-containing protein [Sulfuricurvum sp.]MDD2781785.1 DUF3617 domain-containing protein [Sulfuricurvum sp.]
MKHGILVTGFTALIFATLSAEASSLRPGVWEYTTTIKTQSGEMEKAMAQMEQQLASLPPEQRKMMEKTMASHGVAKSSKPNTYKVCITKEQASKGFIPSSDEHCQQKIVRKSGNTVWFTFKCKGNPPSSGEGKYTLIKDSSYQGTMKVKTTVEGKTETVDMSHTGKWISGDCNVLKKVK